MTPLCSDFSQQPYTTDELRKLAAWYRRFAEHAGEPRIWEARLLTAEKLDAEANRLEAELGVVHDHRKTGTEDQS
jgi:hypothetical protein